MYRIGKKYRKECTCPVCDGIGIMIYDRGSADYGDDCSYCKGTGIVTDAEVQIDGVMLQVVELQETDSGFGSVYKKLDYRHTSL